ncbi:hypothetical protein [Dyadobacter sp. BHUBP1]|uniref:hypothetical protein n=1 Tax=Dyadobacter sp. BHUBP1 TaxID=3424178 RepID=UPI003D342448
MKQQDILNFWRNVEVFNLPDFNKDFFALTPNSAFPWQSRKPLRNPKTNVWRYTLLFGKIPKKEVAGNIEALLKVAEMPTDWDEPIVGDTCFSALLLDEDGRPDPKSYIPAAFMFGINCLEDHAGLAAVPEKIADAQSDFEVRYNIPPFVDETSERKGESVTWRQLEQEIRFLKDITKGWNNIPIQVFAIAKEVPKDAEPDTSFLNSFYLNDLNKLIEQGESAYGEAFKQYLSVTVDEKGRDDLVVNRPLLCKTISPDFIPMGRWPAKTAYGLYTAQAGAVNVAIGELQDGAAEIVVKRAIMLMTTGPDDLFAQFTRIEREEGFSGYFRVTTDSLCDSGIVEASNNNTAVENITKALPSIEKIDRVEFSDADHFARYSGRLIEGESWGVLSAALGNAQNKADFKWKFWLGDTEKSIPGFQDMLWSIYRAPDSDQTFIYKQKIRRYKR